MHRNNIGVSPSDNVQTDNSRGEFGATRYMDATQWRDPREQKDVASEHPDVVANLRSHFNRLKALKEGGAGLPAVMDGAAIEELKALGYVD